MLAHTLKTAAIAALLGLGIAGTSGTSASAYTIKTKCYGDDCVRMQCNNYGYDCFRIGYFDGGDYDRPYGYTRTYTYTYPAHDGYYDAYGVYHYRNHFDYDNDSDEDDYPG
jgi:hypothetical protein